MGTEPGTGADQGQELQFDRVAPAAGAAPAASAEGPACSACRQPIQHAYHLVQGQTVCASCRQGFEGELRALQEQGRGLGSLVRAGLFGLGAALVGAALYYAVIALTNLEIGLVAIVIGYLVGYAVRKGARTGGRRFQVLAVALTYLAVGLAYAPLAYQGMRKAAGNSVSSPASGAKPAAAATAPAAAGAPGTGAPTADAPAAGAPADEAPASGGMSFGLALLITAAMVLALPVLSVVGSLPSGLLSALIIGFGLRQAWLMTGAPAITITGPYALGTAPATPTTP